ncbi:VWA domain-containing protein, partial [Salmonella enterica subsp. enterica serovar Typhimurium]|uniref:VWA domain-containing protein n=1 Tax=Salmonella enterica TaxID=28901 RepID=UPI0020A40204
VEQPVWQRRAPLVVALDLSGAILATDLPPSRLAQARAKLRTLLERRRDGQIALVAYAGDAFTVTPLTEDAANVALYLDALH